MPEAPPPGPRGGEAGPLSGRTLEGRYRLDTLIGRGGMAEVYRGRHLVLDRPCAIKVIHPGHAADPEAQARFEREAGQASRVDHPNVCRTWDFGRTPDGLSYLVLELIEGEPLSALLQGGPLAPRRALAFASQCAAGLQAAHDAGVVHRDLKPANVLITRRGGAETAVLVDFGLARPLAGGEVTRDGLMVGTPEAMSPEQIAGDPVGPASDQYQLALMTVQMLAGTFPTAGATTQERMRSRLTEAALPLSALRPDIAVPAGVEAALLRALARNPEERFPAVRDFAAALGSHPETDTAAPTEVLPRPLLSPRSPWRRPAWLAGAGLLAVLAVMVWPAPESSLPPPAPGATTPTGTGAPAGPPRQGAQSTPPPAPQVPPAREPAPGLPSEDLVFSDSPGDRLGAREQAERVYRSAVAGDTLRAEAAYMVAETYRREGALASARLWLQRCLDLQERPGCRRLLSQLP